MRLAYTRKEIVTTADRIIDAVAHVSDIPRQDLIGPRKFERLTLARFALFRMLRDREYSLVEIGDLCGKRDHATVIHGLTRYDSCQNSRDILIASEEHLALRRVRPPQAPDNSGDRQATRLAALVAGANRENSEADCYW